MLFTGRSKGLILTHPIPAPRTTRRQLNEKLAFYNIHFYGFNFFRYRTTFNTKRKIEKIITDGTYASPNGDLGTMCGAVWTFIRHHMWRARKLSGAGLRFRL